MFIGIYLRLWSCCSAFWTLFVLMINNSLFKHNIILIIFGIGTFVSRQTACLSESLERIQSFMSFIQPNI